MVSSRIKVNKRGQAAGAAILLAIIAGLLIAFLILIPPKERAELLGDDGTTVSVSSRTTSTNSIEKNLLAVNPGKIDYLAQTDIEHPLPVVNIFTKTEAKILGEKNTAYAKKGIFSEETNDFSFTVPDLTHTENIMLTFGTESVQGSIAFILNGEEIFRGEVPSNGLISLPKNNLRQNNILTLKSISPGLAFWSTNEISISDLKIVADVESTEAQVSRNTFLVSDTEKRNLEKVVLKFQPQCNFNDVGPLKITLNGNEIYNGIPDCDLAFVPIEFSSELIVFGENQIIFQTERGAYILSHLVIDSKLKSIEFPTYYFDLSTEQLKYVKDAKMRIRLTLNFVDVTVSKYGDIVFNGAIQHFDTKEASATLDLSDNAITGSNSLKIKPKKTIEVRELKVDLVK